MFRRSARIAPFAVGLVLAAAALAVESGYGRLEGQYRLGSAILVDPPPDEKTDRLLLYIEGQAAKDLYLGMPGAARPSVCDDALQVKTAGGLQCARDDASGEIRCSLGVLLANGETVEAETC